MADISGITGMWTRYEDTISKGPANELGKEDFLKLLVAQLTHQDPTSPMQDTEFISQLATYSGLEQQINMNKNLEKLIGSTNSNTAASAIDLIDKVVGWIDEAGELQTGLVSFIDVNGGEVYLCLQDNSFVPFNSVSYIGKPVTDKPVTDDEGGSE
jgi:flagellar basal-body rod modification protein FlgD